MRTLYREPVPILTNDEIWQFITNWRLGTKDGWDLVDEIRLRMKREGRISASEDRHLRMIKAYWKNLPVKVKRRGNEVNWANAFFREWLNHELISGRTAYKGVLTSREIAEDFTFRRAFRTLDEVYFYLKGTGFVAEYGLDRRGRIRWITGGYVLIVADYLVGMFKVYIMDTGKKKKRRK